MSRLLKAIVAFGVLNAAAYSCLLPLWEGFDEGYHYGYVQSIATAGQFPVLGKTALSKEIWHAYELTPVSHYLQAYTHAPINFADYFAMTGAERLERRTRLESLPASEKYEPQPDKPNYEVNQAPLPYLFMAMIDRALFGASLPSRILWLRLICSTVAALLLAHGTVLIARELTLPDFYTGAILFCTFSSQMLLAVISHVSNDCFAVPAMAYLIWTAIRAARHATPADFARMSVALTAALLIKAYYLFLVPLPFVILLWTFRKKRLTFGAVAWFAFPLLVFAAPWYARNLLLYNNLSGTVESTSGLGLQKAIGVALDVPWFDSIRYMAHSSLWTGNNSFTTFSASTLNLVLVLLAIGGILCARRARRDAAELTLLGAIFLFCCAIAAITVAFYASSKGAAIAAVPWYQQVLLMPVLTVVFVGLHRAIASDGSYERYLGIFVSAALPLTWTYLLLATYWLKLIPLYGGFPQGPVHFRPLLTWYLEQSTTRDSILAPLCLAPLNVLWTLVVTASVASVACFVALLIAGERIEVNQSV